MSSFYLNITENILRQGGFGELSEAQMKQYTPSIAALLEERIGIELLPKLNDKQTEQLVDLVENSATTDQAWRDFWVAAVPNFAAEMERIVGEFMASLAG